MFAPDACSTGCRGAHLLGGGQLLGAAREDQGHCGRGGVGRAASRQRCWQGGDMHGARDGGLWLDAPQSDRQAGCARRGRRARRARCPPVSHWSQAAAAAAAAPPAASLCPVDRPAAPAMSRSRVSLSTVQACPALLVTLMQASTSALPYMLSGGCCAGASAAGGGCGAAAAALSAACASPRAAAAGRTAPAAARAAASSRRGPRGR